MGYCAQADLSARFGDEELKQLTDEVAATTIDAAEVTAACDEATSLVDGYVSKRYTLPLASVPPVLKTWAVNIARFNLWGEKAVEGSAVKLAYDEAIARLKDVANGAFQLAQTTGDTVPTSDSSIAVVASDEIFTDELLNLMP